MAGSMALRRLIQREIENPLALKMLEGEFGDGDDILINLGDDELIFSKASNLVTV